MSGRMLLACDTTDRVNWRARGASVALGAICLRNFSHFPVMLYAKSTYAEGAHERLSRSVKLDRQREGRLGVALSGPLRATMTGRARPEVLDNKRPGVPGRPFAIRLSHRPPTVASAALVDEPEQGGVTRQVPRPPHAGAGPGRGAPRGPRRGRAATRGAPRSNRRRHALPARGEPGVGDGREARLEAALGDDRLVEPLQGGANALRRRRGRRAQVPADDDQRDAAGGSIVMMRSDCRGWRRSRTTSAPVRTRKAALPGRGRGR